MFGYNGSSPRMWGTLGCGNIEQGDGRIIPTHVGNTIPMPCEKVTPRIIPTHVGNT